MVKIALTIWPRVCPGRVALPPGGPSQGIAAVSTRIDLPTVISTSAALAIAGAALLTAGNAAAQTLAPLSPAEVDALPPEYRTGPVPPDRTETTIGPDGVETITRTRYIPAPVAPQAATTAPGFAPPANANAAYPGGVPQAMGYAPQPAVFERQQWIDECRRRTAGRNREDAGTIIGALLGVIGGGIAGNLIAAEGDKLLGTVVGGAAGGLGGGLIGSLFNPRGRARYDCEAALDAYLSQPAPQRIASRSIPYAAPYPYPVMVQQPVYQYYAPPPQEAVVPVRYEQPQQVIVRETVREEVVPGAARIIPPPPAPRPTKLIKTR